MHDDSNDDARPAERAADIHRVDWAELPLSCPTPRTSLWEEHRRVYIPLQEHGEASCKYCGRRYVLNDPVPGEPEPEFTDEEIERLYHRRVDELRRGRVADAKGAAKTEPPESN